MYDNWFDDAGNLFVLGTTQTGKTSAVREIHAANRRVSIFLNETGENRVPNISGKRVRSVRGLESGLADNEYKFNWLSSDREADIQTLKDWAWSKAEQSDRKFPMQIIVDEAHRVAPQSGEKYGNNPSRDRIRDFAKEGIKRNIKLVCVTQDPVSLDKEALRQRKYLLLMELTKEQTDYVDSYVNDLSVLYDQSEYSGVLYHRNGKILETGVKARGKYA